MTTEALQDVSFAFLSILFEGAPFILLGTLLSGFIDVYLPPGLMDRMLPRRAAPAVMVSGLLGILFPVCECAVVPVIRRLVRKGLPVSCALTYMLAAPVLNPVTALSTWKAFSGQGAGLMTSSRLVLGYAVAVAVGLVVARLPLRRVLRRALVRELGSDGPTNPDRASRCGCHGNGEGAAGEEAGAHVSGSPSRVLAAFRSALQDFVDVGVYFSVGVAITALFNTGIAPGAGWLDSLAGDPVAAPAALMGLAFVLSLCSTSDAFIAATLDKFTYGAKLAFLVFGPMMDLKLLFLYQTVMRRRFILVLAAGLFVAIGGAAILWQHLLLRML